MASNGSNNEPNSNTQSGSPDSESDAVRIESVTTLPPAPGATTRNILAYVLVGSFFLIAAIPLFAIFGDTTETDMMKRTTNGVDWLKGVSAYLSGLVGAVLGYYYRTETTR